MTTIRSRGSGHIVRMSGNEFLDVSNLTFLTIKFALDLVGLVAMIETQLMRLAIAFAGAIVVAFASFVAAFIGRNNRSFVCRSIVCVCAKSLKHWRRGNRHSNHF